MDIRSEDISVLRFGPIEAVLRGSWDLKYVQLQVPELGL